MDAEQREHVNGIIPVHAVNMMTVMWNSDVVVRGSSIPAMKNLSDALGALPHVALHLRLRSVSDEKCSSVCNLMDRPSDT